MSCWSWRIGCCLLAWLAASPCGTAAALFRPPADVALPFRRDRLPLDIDTMVSLAAQLTQLAEKTAAGGGPADLRVTAQLLALAQALDPAQPDSRALTRQLIEGAKPKPPNKKLVSRACSQAWKLQEWLAGLRRNPDAKTLAACLGDALAAADPNHPRANSLRSRGERGAWKGWVAALASFRDPQSKPVKPPAVEPKTKPPERQGKDRAMATADPPPDAVPLKLAEAVVRVPLSAYQSEIEQHLFDVYPLQLAARQVAPAPVVADSEATTPKARPAPSYSLSLGSAKVDARSAAFVQTIRSVVSERHGGLPSHVRASLKVGAATAGYDSALNRDAAGAALALLMDATISGEAPATNTIVYGSVDPDGKIVLPWRPWETLRLMADKPDIPSGRLVLPLDALPLLESLLVIEKPEFLLRFEVLLAGNLGDLIDCSAPALEGDLKTASEGYAEIRATSAGKTLGPFLANRFVKERLAEVTAAYPNHASARLLLMQGKGERPVYYERSVLAREIRHAIKPMAWIPKTRSSSTLDDIAEDKFEQAWEECRAMIDPLENRVARDDEDLFDRCFDVVQGIRSLKSALARQRKARAQAGYSTTEVRGVDKSFRELLVSHAELQAELATLTGEEAAAKKVKPKQPKKNGALKNR